jgi:Na+/H+ antiporter NhaD/arsenite permease-like protein
MSWRRHGLAAIVALLISPAPGWCAGAVGKLDAPWWSALPFALLLGSVALLPLVRGHWWHSNRNKALVAVAFALPVAVYLLVIGGRTNGESTRQLLHEQGEFASFIIMLGALYVISAGILLDGDIPAKPRTNTLFLGAGALLANIVGTTGASMILIRPVLRINRERRHRVHLPVFFIFVVSNTGGLLTPLGDPPLFLGFIQGVDFFWTLRLWPQWLLVNGILLAIFFVWDTVAYRKEPAEALRHDAAVRHRLWLVGLRLNGPLLAGVLLAVILQSEAIGQGLGRWFGAGNLTLTKPWGEVAMIVLALISLAMTPRSVLRGNHFTWGPMLEVAILFAGIFVTMVPALALMREKGAPLPAAWHYFWLTGLLSAVLDNAPAYLTFATLAAGDDGLGWLSANNPQVLAAISCGAVFMGALTYIGNGPNFMVKAIAEAQGYQMPTFGGFLLYSAGVLLPIFALVTWVFF